MRGQNRGIGWDQDLQEMGRGYEDEKERKKKKVFVYLIKMT
jgi:hypothetical protein